MTPLFQAGQIAQIKATGEIVTISSVSPGLNQLFYMVYQNGKRNRYKESELEPYIDKESCIIDAVANSEYANAESFQKYAYYRLFSESQDGNLYSYQGNKIIFNPFQYKPLLKFIGVDSDERLLIADEVGVGKTIETGIILDELLARGELKANDPVMIVCPNILCNKWRSELREKFLMDDYFVHDGKSLTYLLSEIKETGKVQYPHSIVSEQLFRGEKYQQMLKDCVEEVGEPIFRLLIIDECHHYRNPGTNTHRFGATLSLASDRVVMLSATPFNLRSDDLYNQLHILNPALFTDQHVFNHLLKQIRNVNQAISLVKKEDQSSRIALQTIMGELKPIADSNSYIASDFDKYYKIISLNKALSVSEKVDFEKCIGTLNPIASSFTRTLKRDAIEHRVTRETFTFEVVYSQQEKDVYNSFLESNLLRYKMLGISEKAFGLILNGLERMAASSIIALEKNVKRYIEMPEEEFAELVSDDMGMESSSIRSMKTLLEESYSGLLNKIRAIGLNDSKYAVFKGMIENIQQATEGNRRVIVFSFYVETLKYLRRRLSADGYKVALMYGKTPDETPNNQKDEDGFTILGRTDIMKAFEKGTYDILLASEVGGEGLDFQFCSSLVNYDLPYNPMRIEQRIGRIDRMGQKSDKILIGNLCIKDTIDEVINRVLLSRISDASDLVGELEPIIAAELVEINSRMITRDFSAEELSKREKEIEQRIEKAKQIREEFEEARYELVNDKAFRDEFESSIKRSRITPHESLLFTYSFLKKQNGCWCKLESDSGASIHVSKDMCERLRIYLKKKNLGRYGDEIKKLLDSEGDLCVDFDGDAAYEDENRVFFKPSGAWIHFIIDYIRALDSDNPEYSFYGVAKASNLEGIPSGRHWVFVYEMELKGFYENKTFEYILSSEDGKLTKCLSDSERKALFKEVKNSKIPEDISVIAFDDVRMGIEDAAEQRKEEIVGEAISANSIKIGSRAEAIKKLSEMRIREMENNMIAYPGKEERLRKAIAREKKKVEEKINVLEEKKKIVGTYSLDAVCLLDVGQ